MSRHLEILRKTKREAELFSRPVARETGHSTGRVAGSERPQQPRPASQDPWNGDGDRDQWQQLAHQLFLRRDAEARNSVGLAAATAGEGTSFVAFHLAAELARSTEHRTLLVETNLHRPAQAERHGVEPDPGLRHLLLDRSFPLESCLHQTPLERLTLLPAGSPANGLDGAPDWTGFPRIFQMLRQRFSAIVADLPPVNLSTDALIIAPCFDAVVLIVQADLCSREVIQNAAAQLRRANSNLAGAILNRRKFFVPEPLYRRL